MPDYNRLKIQDLRQIAKDKGLLRPDKDKKRDLIARIEKGRQPSDYSKKDLLEQAQNIGLKANAQMSKGAILKKLTNPSLQDLGEKRLREVAKQRGVPLRGNMSGKDIIERIENPTAHHTIANLKGLAKDNNIDIKRGQTKREIIEILTNANVISLTEKIEVSNLGFMTTPNESLALAERMKRTVPRNAFEDLQNYRNYLKHIRTEYLTTTRLCQIKRTLKKKEDKLKFTPIKTLSTLKQFANVYTIGRDGDTTTFVGYDPITFLTTAGITLIPILEKNEGIKVKLDFHCEIEKGGLIKGGVVIKPAQYHSSIELN